MHMTADRWHLRVARAMRPRALAGFACALSLLATGATGCISGGHPSAASPTPSRAATATAPAPEATWTDATSPTAVPLGDGLVTTSPKVGFVDSCTTTFPGGGAQHAGPWINTADGTWNAQTKQAVSGRHAWPAASFTMSVTGSDRVITTNDLPSQPTGTFPIAASDPAYQYDRNPNSVVAQSLTYRVPAAPTAAATPGCTSLGPIGVTMDGALLFNALDAGGRDAGAHEVQDSCQGHPNGQGEYHYHAMSSCLLTPAPGTAQLVGYAFDGFGIYAEWNAAGALPTNADLDACHGRTSTVPWDGASRALYHYDVTLEYPYTVGCFHGTAPQGGPGRP